MGRIFGYFLIGIVVIFMIIDCVNIFKKKKNSAIHTNMILIYTLVPAIMILLSFIPEPWCYLALGVFVCVLLISFSIAERVIPKNNISLDIYNLKKENLDSFNDFLKDLNIEFEIKKRRSLSCFHYLFKDTSKQEIIEAQKEINNYIDSLMPKKKKIRLILMNAIAYVCYIAFIYGIVCTGLLDGIL